MDIPATPTVSRWAQRMRVAPSASPAPTSATVLGRPGAASSSLTGTPRSVSQRAANAAISPSPVASSPPSAGLMEGIRMRSQRSPRTVSDPSGSLPARGTREGFIRYPVYNSDSMRQAAGPSGSRSTGPPGGPHVEGSEDTMTTKSNAVARVTRRYGASPERVFDAWLDPSTARRFLFTIPTGEIVRAEIEPRVGGTFHVVDRRNGSDVDHEGTYLEIDRPRHLKFEYSADRSDRSRVSVDIAPSGAGCVVKLSHELHPD